MALLNSRLIHYLYQEQVGEVGRVFPEIKPVQLRKLPIRTIDFASPADVTRHDRMVALVQRMLNQHKQLAAATLPQQKSMLQMQIDATDRQIDQLVYELYRLTQEEIAIVEGKD